MKVKTTKLSCVALDWVVAQIENSHLKYKYGSPVFDAKTKRVYRTEGLRQIGVNFSPSKAWLDCGPFVEHYKISVGNQKHLNVPPGSEWYATNRMGSHGFASTALEAVCKCFVHQELGDEVEIPDELI